MSLVSGMPIQTTYLYLLGLPSHVVDARLDHAGPCPPQRLSLQGRSFILFNDNVDKSLAETMIQSRRDLHAGMLLSDARQDIQFAAFLTEAPENDE